MYDQWSHLKKRAVQMRKQGASLRDVARKLSIAKSTLSYWFRSVELSSYHKRLLKKRADNALILARKEALKWHNAQREARLRMAQTEARRTLERINMKDDSVAELSLALLYLGEGMKKNSFTAMGNSDPLILKFFVAMLERLYKVPRSDMRCEIHIRADQNVDQVTEYWSSFLKIPKANFGKPSIDQRTKGRPTYSGYKGVCVVRCSRVAIQRKLVYISTTFCTELAEQ